MILQKFFFFLFVLILFLSCAFEEHKSQDNYDYTLNRNKIIVHFYQDTFRFIDSVTEPLGRSDTIHFTTNNIAFLDTIEVIDPRARFIQCTAKLNYSIAENNIKKIVNDLEWFEMIEEYEAYIILPYMRQVIRGRAITTLKPELISCDSFCMQEFTTDLKDSLSVYAEVQSFEITFLD